MTLSPAPAHAGTWSLVYTASGTETTKPTDPSPTSTFSDSSTGTNTVSSTKAFSAGFNQPGGVSTSITVNVSVTGTWVPDSSLPSDPAPPSVEVIETAGIFQGGFNGDGTLPSGAADDGLSDASIITPDSQGHTERLSATPANTTPVQHLSTQTGSSFTLSHTLTANSTAAAYTYHNTDATAKFVSYTVTVHAQPYNYTQTTGGVYGDSGAIQFTYTWLSTSGNLGDLGSCYFHERVTYPGGNPYTPPPPFDGTSSYQNPTVYPGTGINGYVMTGGVIGDTQYPWATPGFRSTYSDITIPAPQRYEFDDIATGDANVLVPGPDSTDTITRSITNNRPPYLSTVWWYTCTKNGVTSWVQLN